MRLDRGDEWLNVFYYRGGVSLSNLAGRVAVITGASRGIGREIAVRMAEQRAKVVVSSRSLEATRQVADAINAATGPETAIAVAASQYFLER